MKPGIYKLFNKTHGDGASKRLLGRILIHDNKLYHLEDHGMKNMFPEGDLNEVHEKCFEKCGRSHYFALEKEDDSMDLEESLGS